MGFTPIDDSEIATNHTGFTPISEDDIAPTNAPQSLDWSDAASFVGKSALQGGANTLDLVDKLNPFSASGSQGQMIEGAKQSIINEMLKRGISQDTLNSPQVQAMINEQVPKPTTISSLLQSVIGSPYDIGNGQEIVKTPATEIIKAVEEGSVMPGGQVGNALASGGAEIGHQVAPNSVIAPFVGALGGGGAASAGEDLVSILGKVLGPQTEARAARTAAETLGRVSETTPGELESAITANASDPLASSKTSAEILQSPALATLEQAMGTARPTEMAASAGERAGAANELLDSIAVNKGAMPENTGAIVQDAIAKAEGSSKGEISDLYDLVPQDAKAKIFPLKAAIQDAKSTYFGPGSPPMPRDLQFAFDYLTNKSNQNVLTVGELQRLRSHTLEVADKAFKLGNNQEGAMATAMSQSIAKTIAGTPEAADAWKAANSAMSEHAGVFNEGPLSKVAGSDASKVINNILATPESAAKAATMIGDNPKAIQAIKDQVGSDLMDLSDVKRIKYINDKESQLQKLLPEEDFSALDAIRNDAQSRIKSQASANPTRGSNTALKLSGTIQRALTGKDTTQPSTWNTLLKGVLQGGGAAAAFTNPQVAIPAALAAAGIKGLRDRSSRLVQDALFNQLKDPEAFAAALKNVPAGQQSVIMSALKGVTANNPQSLPDLLNAVVAKNGGSTTPALREALSTVLNKGGTKMDNVEAPKVLAAERMPATSKDEAMAKIKADPTALAIAMTESNLKPDLSNIDAASKAKNPDSTAEGLYQFVDKTAKSLGLKDKTDIPSSVNAFETMTEQNQKIIGSNDPDATYLAHVLGAPLAKKVLNQTPLTSDEQKEVNYFFVPNAKGQSPYLNFKKNYALALAQSGQA